MELVIVDDGSSDNSVELLTQLAEQHDFKLICQENRGAHEAINRAIGESSGEFLSILNSDDVYRDSRLSKLFETAKRENASFLYTGLEFIDDEGRSVPNHWRATEYRRIRELSDNAPEPAQFLPGNPAITTSNFFFSRDLWQKVGPFRNLRYTHDWDWALRASSVTHPHRVDENLLNYRVHDSNTLSEGAIWRHISENSFIFASHLNRSEPEEAERAPSEILEQYFELLLGNDSFLPVPTLLFLNLLREIENEDLLLGEMSEGNLPEQIKSSVHANTLPFDLFLSCRQLEKFLPRQYTKYEAGENLKQRLQRKSASLIRRLANRIEDF
jgi:glycosyltransferase involved in cell wall biosynthesis